MQKEKRATGRWFVMALLALMISVMAFPVTVSAAVKLNQKKVSVFIGKKAKLKLDGASGKVKWESTNPAVARVSKKGIVSGISQGKCRVIAKYKKKTYKCTVTVKSVLAVNTNELTMIKGEKTAAVVTFTHDGTVRYKSSDENVVDCKWQKGWYSNGNKTKLYLTAKKPGTAVVTVSNTFNKEKCRISVVVKPRIIADGRPHFEARLMTRNVSYSINGVSVQVTNEGNLDMIISGSSGTFSMIMGGGSTVSGSIWKGYHYYHERSGKTLEALTHNLKELQGETIVIHPGETVQFYIAFKRSTYTTDDSCAGFTFTYNNQLHMAIVEMNGRSTFI